jgi:hypothetical protein
MPSSSKEGFFMTEQGSTETASAGDFVITYHGIVSTIDALTDACLSWIEENVEIKPWQWLGKRRIGIDPSVAEELREALIVAGFSDRAEDEGGSVR